MKKIILITAICLIATNLFSQTYKQETIFSDKVTETYLSHWKVLETTSNIEDEIFSLWGYHFYSDDASTGTYEIEYFKGSGKEMFEFLTYIIQFTEKYKDEDKILTHILGVQVKTLKQLGFKYTLVYDKENKVVCKFNLKQWSEFQSHFISYCEKLSIDYR